VEELHAANDRLGWRIGTPAFNERRDEWSIYIYDPSERQKLGHRSREWTTVAPTPERALRSAAYCLRETSEGRVPK
jgi:hypothetical protein